MSSLRPSTDHIFTSGSKQPQQAAPVQPEDHPDLGTARVRRYLEQTLEIHEDESKLIAMKLIEAYIKDPSYPTDEMIRELRVAAGLDSRNEDAMEWDRDRHALQAALNVDQFHNAALELVQTTNIHEVSSDELRHLVSNLIVTADRLGLVQ